MIFNHPINNTQPNQCFKNRKEFQRPALSANQNSQDNQSLLSFKRYMDVADKFAHNFLYCRFPSQGLTASQSKVLANQRVKYLSFIKQSFKYKIPQQFLQKNSMIQKHKQYKKKIKQQRMKKQEGQQIKAKKRPRTIKQKQGVPKKRVKGNQQQNKDVKQKTKENKKKKIVKPEAEEDAQNLSQQQIDDYSNNFEDDQDNFQSEQEQNMQQFINL